MSDERPQATDDPTASGSGGSPERGRGSSGSDAPPPPPDGDPVSDAELVAELHDRLERVESTADDETARRAARALRVRTYEATLEEVFGDRIQKYTSRDIAEAFVGSVFFSIPFLVEDGVFDVAAYFLSFRVAGFPVFFVANAAFVVGIVWALVYWTGPQEVAVSRPLFGIVPRRLAGITVVSFLTAAMLMTMWGRVGGWADPVVAVARISAVWTVASFGAALGDILPGESSGDDINDDLRDLRRDVTDLVDGPD